MEYYVGLDVSLKQTAICVVDGDCEVVWQGCADTHPEMILSALDRWAGKIARLGLETGSITPWLARALKARGLPVIVMDARRASDAMKARPVKTDRADARALAEMLQSGWYWEVYLKSEDSHRRKALLSARGSAGAQQAQLLRPDPRAPAALRHPARRADGDVEVRPGRAGRDPPRRCAVSERERASRGARRDRVADRGARQGGGPPLRSLRGMLAADDGPRRRPPASARSRRWLSRPPSRTRPGSAARAMWAPISA